MSLVFLYIAATIGLGTFVATVIGISLSDIRSIRSEKQFRRHPHARRWRVRPTVYVITDGILSDLAQASIRRGSYRKIEIISDNQQVNGEMVLTIKHNIIVGTTAISEAIKQFNGNSSINSIEIIPVLDSPQNIRQFFHLYYIIASAPFVTARSGLGITVYRSSWPLLARMQTSISARTRIYLIVRYLAVIANIYVLAYVSYIALFLYQPEYLLLYLAVFGLWMLWAISRYQQMHFRHKLLYLSLAPASLIYFAVRSLLAPLRLPISAIIRT